MNNINTKTKQSKKRIDININFVNIRTLALKKEFLF